MYMANAPSIPIGKQKRTLSSEQWRGVWLKKLEQACATEHGAKIDAVDFQGMTPLMIATLYGSVGVM